MKTLKLIQPEICRRLLLLGIGIFSLSTSYAQEKKEFSKETTDVWIVIKSHFDLGYTDLAENVFERYRGEMMENALKVIDENRKLPKEQQFVWTVPGWPLYAQMLGTKQDTERKKRVEQAVREGSLVPHALAFSTHTESLDLEDLTRSLRYSAKVCKNYGGPLPIAAKMTDVPSHSWIMPTLLKHAGIKFLHIGVNAASQYPRVPPAFWWEGSDGSKILCFYTFFYGSDFLPPPDWKHKNYLSMIMANDNHGPPSVEEVEKWRMEYQKKMPNVKVHFGSLDDFAEAFLNENPDLPVVRGDMPDAWIQGLMSTPKATKTVRVSRPLEPALESLDAHLRSWGGNAAPVEPLSDDAFEKSILYGEHTWGMNAEYGPRTLYGEQWKDWLRGMEQEPLPPGGDYSKLPRGSKRKWMQSYKDHEDYANACSDRVHKEIESRLNSLASSVKAKEKSVLVYNALPWKRSGIAELDGNKFFAEDVPANGYKVIPFKSPSEQKTSAFETKFYVVKLDLEKGGIKSLADKATGKELVDQSQPYVVGQFLHERFSTAEVFDRFFKKYSRILDSWGLADIGKPGMPNASSVPYLATTPKDWTSTFKTSATENCITLTTDKTVGLAKSYAIEFIFPHHEPYIDVRWNVENKTPEKHPEGGWLCFPFNVSKPQFSAGRLGAPIDPAKDIIPGTNRHLLAVNSGVTCHNEETAISVCPVDSPLISLGEPGLWRWSMDYIPTKPIIFVNLYNNMWNTNFRLWQEGSWSERVRIWQSPKEINQSLAVKSWEARLPLMAVRAENKDGKWPAVKAGISVSRQGVLMTAFGKNDDHKMRLRLWEQSGVSGKVTVTFPKEMKYKTAQPVTLRDEATGNAIKIQDHKLQIDLHRYSPASFVLTE